MILGSSFEAFVKESPISVMMRGIVENTFDAQRIDELFEQTAESQYTRYLPFSTVADLMSEVVFNISPSIGAAYQANSEMICVSRKSVYNKLNGVEPQVSQGLVHDTVKRFTPVVDELEATLAPLLAGYRVKILDGNHFSSTEHRLEVLRSINDGPLPGQALVVLDPQLQLATKVVPCEDGHAQERSLLDHILPDVEPGDLWISDRNFCTLRFIFGIDSRGGKFLIRQHGNLKGTPLGKRKFKGCTDTGKVYQQRLLLTCPETGKRFIVVRITIELFEPTRNGETVIHLLTNVPVKDATPEQLANLYQERWCIETLFQELTQTLTCEIKTLAYPKAAIFAFCLALVAYNGISVIKAALRAVHGIQTVENEISGYYLSLEIAKTYTGMMIAIPPEKWMVFRNLTATQLAQILKELAGYVVLSKYEKHPRGPKKANPKRIRMSKGNHVSTARILARRNIAN